jgi:predicted xylose isomerase-like sugar epimerase
MGLGVASHSLVSSRETVVHMSSQAAVRSRSFNALSPFSRLTQLRRRHEVLQAESARCDKQRLLECPAQ